MSEMSELNNLYVEYLKLNEKLKCKEKKKRIEILKKIDELNKKLEKLNVYIAEKTKREYIYRAKDEFPELPPYIKILCPICEKCLISIDTKDILQKKKDIIQCPVCSRIFHITYEKRTCFDPTFHADFILCDHVFTLEYYIKRPPIDVTELNILR